MNEQILNYLTDLSIFMVLMSVPVFLGLSLSAVSDFLFK